MLSLPRLKSSCTRMWCWLASICHPAPHPRRRQLRLCESLALGERCFLNLVEVGDQKFLVGRTGTTLALLAVLSGKPMANESEDENAPVGQLISGEPTRSSRCA